MYDYIDHVLANYFSDACELSDYEAVALLRQHLQDSVVLREALKTELAQAFKDAGFPWKKKFEEFDVIPIESDDEAREYAKSVLWTPYFEDDGSLGS